MGVIENLWVWIKILEFAGMLFIYLKVESKKSVPEPSAYNYSVKDADN